MKKLGLLFVAVAFSAVSSAQNWTMNMEGAKVNFNVVSKKTTGTFKKVESKITFDVANLTASEIEGTIDVNSIDTKNKARDKHLLSADYFDAKKFSTITFNSTSIIKSRDGGYKMAGKITIKGVEKDINLHFTFSETDGKGIFKAKAMLMADDFGVVIDKKKHENNKIMIEIEIPVSAASIKKEDAAKK